MIKRLALFVPFVRQRALAKHRQNLSNALRKGNYDLAERLIRELH